MYVLGLATMGESAAALFKDGILIAAVEEERFTRVKHEGCFPLRSIRSCLRQADIGLADVEHIGIYWQPWKIAGRVREIFLSLWRRPRSFGRKWFQTIREFSSAGAGKQFGSRGSWLELFWARHILEKSFGPYRGKIHYLDHHRCHLASAFFLSPFEEAALLAFDGAGEEATTTLAVGTGRTIKILKQLYRPHSLGHFYASLTGFLGFQMLDGEYKMMGLAPYNSPDYLELLRREFLVTDGPGSFRLNSNFLDYHDALEGLFSRPAQDALGPPRKKDEPFTEHHEKIASSAQEAFERVVKDLAFWTYQAGGRKKNLCISGGCGLNATANGRLLREGPFQKLYVPPAPHDTGAAIGAAILIHHEKLNLPRQFVMEHASYGPSFTREEVSAALAARGISCLPFTDEEDLLRQTVEALCEGKIVAWFQGRMEFGPRALGNRSFLADPRRDSIRDTLNQKIKKRELFRPFAPSVKEERARDYFDLGQPSPFMNIVVPVLMHKRSELAAVTHVDGTARVQTVSRTHNPRYWRLLDFFEKKTGVPVLLNTSFNIQEPIVCTPEEAIETFIKSGIDILILEDYFITRSMIEPAINSSLPAIRDIDYNAAYSGKGHCH